MCRYSCLKTRGEALITGSRRALMRAECHSQVHVEPKPLVKTYMQYMLQSVLNKVFKKHVFLILFCFILFC